jgi:hypothetical protein
MAKRPLIPPTAPHPHRPLHLHLGDEHGRVLPQLGPLEQPQAEPAAVAGGAAGGEDSRLIGVVHSGLRVWMTSVYGCFLSSDRPHPRQLHRVNQSRRTKGSLVEEAAATHVASARSTVYLGFSHFLISYQIPTGHRMATPPTTLPATTRAVWCRGGGAGWVAAVCVCVAAPRLHAH